MKIHELKSSVRVAAPIERVFDFFSRAENLERLTPASLKFKILTPLPIEMKVGSIIDYRLQLLGIPFGWRTEITVWEPGVRFVDVQRKGPYLLWEHEHLFSAEGSVTRMEDHLRYAVPGGILEPVIHALFVRRQVEKIFEYRNGEIARIFGA